MAYASRDKKPLKEIAIVDEETIQSIADLIPPAEAAWGSINGTLSSQSDLNSALSGKQSALSSGVNIKTINSTSLLGSGDIEIGGITQQQIEGLI